MPELGASPAGAGPVALAAAVCSVLASLAGGNGLTLFLDDLQWADEASLDLLPVLADAACGLLVALVGCYRSDELLAGTGCGPCGPSCGGTISSPRSNSARSVMTR